MVLVALSFQISQWIVALLKAQVGLGEDASGSSLIHLAMLLGWESVTCLWDGIFEDVRPFLLTVMKSNDGKPDSYHKSKCGSLSWQTCYDTFIKGGMFKQLNI